MDVCELRDQFWHVADGVELQFPKVGPQILQGLLLSRSEQSLPCAAGVREAEDEKGLAVRRDEVLAAIRGADGPGFRVVGVSFNHRGTEGTENQNNEMRCGRRHFVCADAFSYAAYSDALFAALTLAAISGKGVPWSRR